MRACAAAATAGFARKATPSPPPPASRDRWRRRRPPSCPRAAGPGASRSSIRARASPRGRGSAPRPRRRACSPSSTSRLARCSSKPIRAATGPVKSVKPPETRQRIGAVAPAWCAPARGPPGVSVMRSAMISSTTPTGRPCSSATRSRSAGSKAISPRMARSVIADTSPFSPTIVGELVDAFLPDHGRIHVGQEQALAPALAAGWTMTSTAAPPSAARSARLDGCRIGAGACERECRPRRPCASHSARVRACGSAAAARRRSARVSDGRSGFAIRVATRREVGMRREIGVRGGRRPSSSQGRPPRASRPWRSRLARGDRRLVVNADSMQVYRDLRILTARPEPDEEARGAHRLYGHVDGAVNYSVGRYLSDAGRDPRGRIRTGRLPIFVGGTGLYFKALTEGLSRIPAVPEAVRAARPGRQRRASRPPDLHAASRARSGDGRAPCARPIGSASCARSRCWPRPGSRSALSRRAGARAARRPARAKRLPSPGPRALARGASTRASRP